MTVLKQSDYERAATFLKSFNPHISLTRGGLPVIIFTDQAGGELCPLMGTYWNGDEWVACKWMSDGKFASINEKVFGHCKLDLDLTKPEDVEVA